MVHALTQSKPFTPSHSLSFKTNNLPLEVNHIQVVRRDGSKTNLDIGRIRAVVVWACNKFNVNPIALEAGLTTKLKNGITTREIQENLVNCALEMCSPEEPDWRYVAGKLHIWGLWKDVLINRNYQYGNYPLTVQHKLELNQYDQRMCSYSSEELQEAGSWINSDWDLDYDYAGAILLTSRYLLKDELPQEALLTCSLLLALPEKPEERLMWAKKFYQAIACRKVSLATPILANLRVPGGSLTSCFIIAIDDNLDSIFREITNAAKISKNGGGIGANLSKARASGSTVMGKPNASGGVVPWIKLLNDTAVAVNQGGKRSGAITVSLDVWHLDVPEFLEMQTENGDQRRKAYDVFPQLVLPDEFMRRVINNENWTLVDPYEVRTELKIELAETWGDDFELAYTQIELELGKKINLYKKVNARNLFKDIMKSQIETGMPYLAFKDTINRANPNKHAGYIPSVNLCVESFSNVKSGEQAHCCNLISLNLATVDEHELEEYCAISVRMLDNTIDITNAPFKDAETHNNLYRTIGVGAMGLADWLAKRHLDYESLDRISNLFENFGYWCTHSSMELAKERGAYTLFPDSEWSKGNLINSKPVEWFQENASQPDRWLQLSEDIKKYGIRNSMLSAIAPNTSSSLVQGCTASILPVYSRFFYDKWTKGVVPIAPPFINEFFWFYKENKNLNQNKVVKAVATIQQWIDTGISMELLFNLNQGVYNANDPDEALSARDIFDTLILAWEKGCKAVYYIRTVQKDNFKESENGCTTCAN